MKKLYLAASIAALMATSGAQAVEVFSQGDTKVSIGGYADIFLQIKSEKYDKGTGTPESDSRIHFNDNASRINFVFTQGLSGNWKAQAKYEMAFKLAASNALRGKPGKVDGNNANDIFSSRVSYVAIMNENAGGIYFGKNWGAYYEVGGVTDIPYAYAPVFGVYELGDGGIPGTGRADSVIQYMHKVAGATIALQYQPFTQRYINTAADMSTNKDKYDHGDGAFTAKGVDYNRLTYSPGIGLALKYDIMGYIELGFGYNMHTITLEDKDVTSSQDLTSSIMAFSLQHGEFASGGFHAGFVFNMAENFGSVSTGSDISDFTLAPEATGMEFVLSYTVADFTPMIGYYTVTAKDSADRPSGTTSDDLKEITRSKMSVGLSYNWTKTFLMYLEGGFDVGSKATMGDGNAMLADDETALQESGTGFSFGMRMYL